MKEGWLCPRCGRVNAPFVNYCECKAENILEYIEGLEEKIKKNEKLSEALRKATLNGLKTDLNKIDDYEKDFVFSEDDLKKLRDTTIFIT